MWEPLFCVRMPSCGRIKNVRSASAHAHFFSMRGPFEGGGWTEPTDGPTVSSPVSAGKAAKVNAEP